MFENPKIIYKSEKKVRFLNFIDVKIILHEKTQLKLIFITNQRILTTAYHTITYTLIIPKITSPTT